LATKLVLGILLDLSLAYFTDCVSVWGDLLSLFVKLLSIFPLYFDQNWFFLHIYLFWKE